MTAWLPLLRWFAVRALLLLAISLAHGCGYSTYNIPPAELQRLAQLPPSQRGEHVRAYTDGAVPEVTPSPPVAASPPSPPTIATAPSVSPPAPQPTTPRPETTNGEQVAETVQGEVDGVPVVEPVEPPVVVSVDLAPPRFVPAPAPPPPVRRVPVLPLPPTTLRPHLPPSIPAHAPGARAAPRMPLSAGHGSASFPRASGGHAGRSLTSHHSGGGGGGAAVGALVGAVVLVGLFVAIAEASQPVLFNGWIRTDSDHPVHLTYKSGWKRDILLRNLKPADVIDVKSAVMYNTEGAIDHLESAAANPAAYAIWQ